MRFLVFLVLLQASALVYQNAGVQPGWMSGSAGLDVRPVQPGKSPGVAERTVQPGKSPGVAVRTVQPGKSRGAAVREVERDFFRGATVRPVQPGKFQGVAGPGRNRGTLGAAPLKGCVFIATHLSFRGWTKAYRAAFVQWNADMLLRSLGAQTDMRFKALVGPGYTPQEIALLAQRLPPENFVVVEGSVQATATRLVKASNCSWVVVVGVDGDDAVAPCFVQDLYATVHREIYHAPPAVRAVLTRQPHLTAVRVDRADGGGIRCRVGERRASPWRSGWSVTQGVVSRRGDFLRSGGALHPINKLHQFLDGELKGKLGCNAKTCVKVVDYPRDSGVHLIGRLSGNFWVRENLTDWRFNGTSASCLELAVNNVSPGWDLMGLLRSAQFPTFGLADACRSNRHLRGGMKRFGEHVRCPV